MNIKFETPVLLITYKRKDSLIKIFDRLRIIKPNTVYISSNYGIDDISNSQINDVRSYIQKAVGWECKVEYLYRNKHLNVKDSVADSIAWFFNKVEYGIILEDDVLPNLSFFWYCQEMLQKYREDVRIGLISGCNFFPQINKKNKNSYFFTRSIHIWGWATWSRVWKKYNREILESDIENFNYYKDKRINSYYKKVLKKIKDGDLNTWDYQFDLTILKNKMISINPVTNLIDNLGFDSDSTNTKFKKPSYIQKSNKGDMQFPLKHPENIYVDDLFDQYIIRKTKNIGGFKYYIRKFIYEL